MSEKDTRAEYDWTEVDVSGISEDDFPIHCDRCGYQLSGLGDSGRCPECFTDFSRRERLWNIYGPEAFAKPAIVDGDAGGAERTFARAVFTAVVCAASLPMMIWIGQTLFGRVDFFFAFIGWLLLVTCVEWIMAARERARKEQEDDSAGDED